MSSEAQRLMMVSIGKIQGCRQQRGGINLFKSLLVSKVLYHARSIALTESVSPRRDYESEDQTVPELDISDENDCEISSDLDHEVDHPSPLLQNTCSNGQDVSSYCDKENSALYANSDPVNYPVNSPEDFSCVDSDNSQNNWPDSSSCTGCVKRRRTEVEEAVDSITPSYKRQRTESGYDDQCHQDVMQVEPPQISTLVNSFSTGFTGLITSDSDDASFHDDNASDVEVQDSCISSSDSLLSCSTQIKESFELLARPIIALSV
jgi:hypothetical protein